MLFIVLLMSSVMVHSQSCDFTGMTTYSQGGWGSPSNSTTGALRDAYFNEIYPEGLILESSKTPYKVTFTSAKAIEDFLPAGGKPGSIQQDWINPVKLRGKNKDIFDEAGVLIGQIVAAKLNVDYADAGKLGPDSPKLGDLIFKKTKFKGMTVRDFLELAIEAVTSGKKKKYDDYKFSEFNKAAEMICLGFHEGKTNKGYFECPENDPDKENVDLELSKTVDKDNPENGDEITFTLTLTNKEETEATGIKVKDYFPKELKFISASASTGEFNENDFVWSINSLEGNGSATLTIKAKVETENINNTVIDLGIAKDYNVFVFEDIDQPSADTEGKMAVGGDARLENYSVGDKLPENSGNVLIVGHNITYLSGRVYHGNLVYGETTNFPDTLLATVDGDIVQGKPINFADAENYLLGLSKSLAQRKNNMEMVFQFQKVTLYGYDPILNIYNLDADTLNMATDFEINAPNGSVVLVNISNADSAEFSGGFAVYGTDKRNVLFNLYNVDKLIINHIDLTGSVLAPDTYVNFIDGVQNGQMIAKSIEGAGQFNNELFLGNIPSDVSVANTAEIVACDQIDVDSEPNNANKQEDDFASINVNIKAKADDDTPLGNSFGNWQYVGGFNSDEIVLSVAVADDNTVYAGTWGGKISSSTNGGKDWTTLYDDDKATFIWDLLIDGDKIFAATEKGVLLSGDGGTNWKFAGLEKEDVRALLKSGDNLLAGTWGHGVFISEDDGSSWKEYNEGLNTNAIHDLEITNAGEILACTFGDGIYKLPANSSSWVKLGLPYRYVWNVGVTSEDYLFAGTYGAGVFRSTDGGATWTKLYNGIKAQYIYSITVDVNDNIYAGSWSNGVFVTDNFGDTWQSLGLNGFGVSVIFNFEPSPGKVSLGSGHQNKAIAKSAKFNNVYVGTGDGKIFWNSPATSVDDKNTLPKEFRLYQNYPNPFNPATNIKFSLPSQAFVSLKVFNILGQEVAVLANEELEGGVHTVNFDADQLSSGIYLYKLSAQSADGNFIETKKMLLLK